MSIFVRVLPLVLAACNLFADDVKLTDGRILKNAKVSKVDPAFITFTYDDGILRAPFEIVPPDLQEKYRFDPQKSATFIKMEAEARRAKAFDALAVPVSGEILQAGKTGFLVALTMAEKPNGTPEITISELGVCYVDSPAQVVDGGRWTGLVWRIGVFQYETVNGSSKTVPKFTTDRETAAKILLGASPSR